MICMVYHVAGLCSRLSHSSLQLAEGKFARIFAIVGKYGHGKGELNCPY